MPGKNKPNERRPRPDTDVARTGKEKNKNQNQTNISNNKTGEINRGNTIHTGYNQDTNELHTKKSVSGSDSDGQAE